MNDTRAFKRRAVIRNSFLFAMTMALGKYDSLKAEGGQLTVNLDQWREVIVSYRKRTIRIPVSEIFTALSTSYEG